MSQFRQLLVNHRFWLRHAGNIACGAAVVVIWLTAPDLPLTGGAVLGALGIVLHAAASVRDPAEISPLLDESSEVCG
jgi:multisubunit Na+/H+ antiporter MnhB subunit